MKTTLLETALAVAVSVPVCFAVTVVVVIVKVPEVFPAGMVIRAGIVVAGASSLKSMTAPPAGAAFASVTLPVADLPAMTEFGAKLSDETSTHEAGGVRGVKMTV